MKKETNEQKLKDIQFKERVKEWVDYGLKFHYYEYFMKSIVDRKDKNCRKYLKEQRDSIIRKLEIIKLDMDVVVCDCGSPYRDSDPADLINDLLKELKKQND